MHLRWAPAQRILSLMNTAHRFWIFEEGNPSVLWLTASTREWAERKVAAFPNLRLRIVEVE